MDAGVAAPTRAPALVLRREAVGQYFFEAAHGRRTLVGHEPAGSVPSVPIVARREHGIADVMSLTAQLRPSKPRKAYPGRVFAKRARAFSRSIGNGPIAAISSRSTSRA